MNDVPPGATSCRVYSYNDLQKCRPIPPVYSIPEDFQECYQLESLQAVFKTIPGASNTCIFSHMLVSPEDIEATLGEKIFQDMRDVQAAVCSFISPLTSRLPETENTKKRLRNTLICRLTEMDPPVTLLPAQYRRSRTFFRQPRIVQIEGSQRTASKNLSVI